MLLDPEPSQPVYKVIDSSDSDFELPDINPQLLQDNPVVLKEAVVILDRLPSMPPKRAPTLEQLINWELVAYGLAMIHTVSPRHRSNPH